jgi:catechol 2,3-dioxygenase-like lactoylglutathione lyase family enzyme
MTAPATFTGLHVFVRDVAASVNFYQRLGLTFDAPGGHFARALIDDGASLEIGSYELTRGYDPNWREPTGPPTNTLNFSLESREAVDAAHADLVAGGYTSHLAPIDAFWGSRYAIINDPDGNLVGLHSPRDPSKGGRPPV